MKITFQSFKFGNWQETTLQISSKPPHNAASDENDDDSVLDRYTPTITCEQARALAKLLNAAADATETQQELVEQNKRAKLPF